MSKKGSYFQKYMVQSGGIQHELASISAPTILPEIKLTFEEGKVILIDKPLHWTSFDVVKKIRNVIKIKKVGHAGTLDPLATGLLIVCTGKFTKKINEFMAQKKEYTGTITLGAVTPTYDLESTPEQEKDIGGINESMIKQAVNSFIGEIDQVPPIYSVIKKKGTPLYELARKGQEVSIEPRKVVVYSFEITNIDLPNIGFKIVCSTGTYIRSIANDVGIVLGCGAYLSSLCRTAIGDLNLNQAVTMESFMQSLTK